MADKIKEFDRMVSKVDLSKFDISLLSNDGGKYSPSIRRLVRNILSFFFCLQEEKTIFSLAPTIFS